VMVRIRRWWFARAYSLLRWSRTTGYALVAAAGGWSVVTPPRSVAAAANSHLVAYVWAGIMVVSAALCAIGSASGRWVGEYMGLIALAFVSAVFGVSALARGNSSIAGGLFLLGFFWILISRWQEVALLRIESVRRHDEYEGRPV
jgi:hypothetical protein